MQGAIRQDPLFISTLRSLVHLVLRIQLEGKEIYPIRRKRKLPKCSIRGLLRRKEDKPAFFWLTITGFEC